MHILLESLAASAGSGLTYLKNVLPHLAAQPGVRVSVLMRRDFAEGIGGFPNVDVIAVPDAGGGAPGRFLQAQREVPRLARQVGADVLISAGNTAVRRSPVPQILLCGNALYVSDDFYRDLRRRGDWRLWLDTRLKGEMVRRSVRWADVTVAPSEWFAEELRRWAGGGDVRAVHHGFDPQVFFGDAARSAPLSPEVQAQLAESPDALRLLMVSHYNYYRNVETLLRAVPLLKQKLGGRPVRLLLTCKLREGANPGSYSAAEAAALVNSLSIRAEVLELGAIPYESLHHLYRASHVYVTAAFAETFAHPLVEAMACGLPVVASDLPVHSEVCPHARTFPRLSAESLASRVAEVAATPDLAAQLSAAGLRRAGDFSWAAHVDSILAIAGELAARLAR